MAIQETQTYLATADTIDIFSRGMHVAHPGLLRVLFTPQPTWEKIDKVARRHFYSNTDIMRAHEASNILTPERNFLPFITSSELGKMHYDPRFDSVNHELSDKKNRWISYSLLYSILSDTRDDSEISADLSFLHQNQEQAQQYFDALRKHSVSWVESLSSTVNLIRHFTVDEADVLLSEFAAFHQYYFVAPIERPAEVTFALEYYQLLSHFAKGAASESKTDILDAGSACFKKFSQTQLGENLLIGPLREEFITAAVKDPLVAEHAHAECQNPLLTELFAQVRQKSQVEKVASRNAIILSVFLDPSLSHPAEAIADIIEILGYENAWSGKLFTVLECVITNTNERNALRDILTRYPLFYRTLFTTNGFVTQREAYITEVVRRKSLISVAEEFESLFENQDLGEFSYYYLLGLRLARLTTDDQNSFDASQFKNLLTCYLDDRADGTQTLAAEIKRLYGPALDSDTAEDIAASYFDETFVMNDREAALYNNYSEPFKVLGHIAALTFLYEHGAEPAMRNRITAENADAAQIYAFHPPLRMHAGPAEHMADMVLSGAIVGGKLVHGGGHEYVYFSTFSNELNPKNFHQQFEKSASNSLGMSGRKSIQGQVMGIYAGRGGDVDQRAVTEFVGITNKSLKGLLLPHPDSSFVEMGIAVLESYYVPIYATHGEQLLTLDTWDALRQEHNIELVPIPHVTHLYPLGERFNTKSAGRMFAVTRYGSKQVYVKQLLHTATVAPTEETLVRYIGQTEHLWASVLSTRVYEALNVPIAKAYVVIHGGQYYLASEWVEPVKKDVVINQSIAQGAIADIFLGNLDIAYAPERNTVVSYGEGESGKILTPQEALRKQTVGEKITEVSVRVDCDFGLWYLPTGVKKGEGNLVQVPLPQEYVFGESVQELAWGSGEKNNLANGMLKYYVDTFGLTYQMLLDQAIALHIILTDEVLEQYVEKTRFSQKNRKELLSVLKARRDDIYTRVVLNQEFVGFFTEKQFY